MKFPIFKFIRFLKHQFIFKKLNDGRFNLSNSQSQNEINDWGSEHSYDGHYIYHTAWASRILYTQKPKKHIDLSSDIRFSSIISTFVKTEYYDIRKLTDDEIVKWYKKDASELLLKY